MSVSTSSLSTCCETENFLLNVTPRTLIESTRVKPETVDGSLVVNSLPLCLTAVSTAPLHSISKTVVRPSPMSLADSIFDLQETTDGRTAPQTDDLRRLGRRAFSVTGPTVWNSLSNMLREQSDEDSFKRQLKTFLFSRTSGLA